MAVACPHGAERWPMGSLCASVVFNGAQVLHNAGKTCVQPVQSRFDARLQSPPLGRQDALLERDQVTVISELVDMYSLIYVGQEVPAVFSPQGG